MISLIPLPIGSKHSVTVRGKVWKFVECEQCHQPYAYQLSLQATGEDLNLLFLDGKDSEARARKCADENLADKGCNCFLPVPCPGCGHYQSNMSAQMKEDRSVNKLQIAGGMVAALALVPLAIGFANAWIVSTILAVAGVTLLILGYRSAFCFNPNAGDPEARKAIGRSHAVWGEELEKVREGGEMNQKNAEL